MSDDPFEWNPAEHTTGAYLEQNADQAPSQTWYEDTGDNTGDNQQQWDDTVQREEYYQIQHNSGISVAGEDVTQGNYWDDPLRVARYYNALEAMPPDSPAPEWMDTQSIKGLYEYYKQRNDGNEDWWDWKPLSADDPMRQYTSQMAIPPPEGMPERDNKLPGETDSTGVYELTREQAAQFMPETELAKYESADNPGKVIIPKADIDKMMETSKPVDNKFGMPTDKFNQLPWWKQVAGVGMPYVGPVIGVGGAAAIGMGVAGPPGAIVAGGVMAGAMALASNEESVKQFLTGFGLSNETASNIAGLLPDTFEALNFVGEQLEKGVGVGIQIEYSLIDEKKYGSVKEIFNNLEAAYNAGASTFESGAVLNIVPDVPYMLSGRTDRSTVTSVDLYSPTDVTWTAPDNALAGPWALAEGRRLIAEKGMSPDEAYNTITKKFGFVGQLSDLGLSMITDPMDWLIGPLATKGIGKIGGITGNVPLAKAFNTPGIEALDAIREYGRELRFMKPEEAARFGTMSRWIAGIDKAGNEIAMNKPGAKPGVLDYMRGLTPQARAAELIGRSIDGVAVIMDQAGNDPIKQVAMVKAIAATSPDEAARVLEQAGMTGDLATYFSSVEGKSIPLAYRGAVDKLDEMADQWRITRDSADIMQRVADYMEKDVHEFIAELHRAKPEEAANVYDTFVNRLKTAAAGGDQSAQKILTTITQEDAFNSFDGRKLKTIADVFAEGKTPFHAEQFTSNIISMLMSHTDKFSVDFFGVKPSNKLIRFTNAMKQAQGYVVLGLNPINFLNNTINNFVTLGWDGLLSFAPRSRQQEFLRGMGITPARMKTGLNMAEVGEIQVGSTKGSYVPGSEIRKALRGDDLIQGMSDLLRKGDKFQIFASMSSKIEQWSSEMAMTTAMRQFWDHSWREGFAYDKMTPDLTNALNAFNTGLGDDVANAIRRGRSRTEIEAELFSNLGRKSLHDVLDTQEKALISAHYPDVFEKLDSSVRSATTPEDVHKAFQDARQSMRDAVVNNVHQDIVTIVQDAMDKAKVERTVGALDTFDGVMQDRSAFWLQHFAKMDQVSEAAAKETGWKRQKIWNDALREADIEWNTFSNIEGAKWLGVFEGLGTDSVTYSTVSNHLIDGYDNWKNYFQSRKEVMNDFFDRSEKMTSQERSAAWEAANVELNKRYISALLEESALQSQIDIEFIMQYAKQFGDDPTAFTEAAAWRNAIKATRQEMASAMVYYRSGGQSSVDASWVLPGEAKAKIDQITRGIPPYKMPVADRDAVSKRFYAEVYTPYISGMLDASNGNAPGMRPPPAPVAPSFAPDAQQAADNPPTGVMNWTARDQAEVAQSAEQVIPNTNSDLIRGIEENISRVKNEIERYKNEIKPDNGDWDIRNRNSNAKEHIDSFEADLEALLEEKRLSEAAPALWPTQNDAKTALETATVNKDYEYIAHHDSETGIKNSAGFTSDYQDAIANGEQPSVVAIAVDWESINPMPLLEDNGVIDAPLNERTALNEHTAALIDLFLEEGIEPYKHSDTVGALFTSDADAKEKMDAVQQRLDNAIVIEGDQAHVGANTRYGIGTDYDSATSAASSWPDPVIESNQNTIAAEGVDVGAKLDAERARPTEGQTAAADRAATAATSGVASNDVPGFKSVDEVVEFSDKMAVVDHSLVNNETGQVIGAEELRARADEVKRMAEQMPRPSEYVEPRPSEADVRTQEALDRRILEDRAIQMRRNAMRLQLEAPKKYTEEAFRRDLSEQLGNEDMAEAVKTAYDSIADYWAQKNGQTRKDWYEKIRVERGGTELSRGGSLQQYLFQLSPEDGVRLRMERATAAMMELIPEGLKFSTNIEDMAKVILKKDIANSGKTDVSIWNAAYEYINALDEIDFLGDTGKTKGYATYGELHRNKPKPYTIEINENSGTGKWETKAKYWEYNEATWSRYENVVEREFNTKQEAEKFVSALEEGTYLYQKAGYDPDLVALHNMRADDLIRADELGGMPVPSIAITKKGIAFDEYGEITFVGNRPMVDPGSNRLNKVYDADAYTQTSPQQVWNKVPANKKRAIADPIAKAARDIDEYGGYAIWDALENSNYDEATKIFERNNAPRLAFLREKGIDIGVTQRDKPYQFRLSKEPEVLDWIKRNIDRIENEELKATDSPLQKELLALIADRGLRQKYSDILNVQEDARAIRNKSVEIDKDKAVSEIKSKFTPELEEEYKRWTASIMKDAFGWPMLELRGKKVPYTLSNIVEAMTASSPRGAQNTMVYGPGKARAAAATEFKNVDQMHRAEGSIKPREEVKAFIGGEQKAALDEFQATFRDKYAYPDTWSALDDMHKALADYLKGGKTDAPDRMRSALRRWDFKDFSDDDIVIAINAANALRNTPTDYFEAKPQRAVGFNEWAGAVIPSDAPQQVRDILDRRGIKYQTYSKDAPGDRQAKVESFYGDPGVLFQENVRPQAWYYSQLSKIVEAIPQERMTVGQLRAAIQKGGVKADEMKFTDMEDLFSAHKDSDKITRAEVLEFIRQHNVQIEEVTHSNIYTRDMAPWIAVDDKGVDWMGDATQEALQARVDKSGQKLTVVKAPDGPVKYESYTLAGGENNRELLMTLPGKERKEPSIEQYKEYFRKDLEGVSDKEIEGMYLTDLSRGFPEGLYEEKVNTFQSGHWREPNVLAHVRFNDRVDAAGNRVLFIEEVQSDWHQEGREKGYKHQPTEADIPKGWKLEYYEEEGWAIRNTNDVVWAGGDTKQDALNQLYAMVNKDAVPDAPFSKSWPDLAMKRMIRYAAENGYDKVAWTTGEMQAARHNLRKQIEELHYSGTNLTAYDKNGNTVVNRTGVSESDLPDVVGKELANKLLAQPKNGTLRSLVGQDIEVGGEGMKGFYDAILPATVQKYIKKWNATVGDAEISGGHTVHSFDVTPEMRSSVMQQGQALFQGNRGATYWADNGVAVIHAFDNSDVSTFLHELFHAWLPMAPAEDIGVLTKYLGEEHGIVLPDGWQHGTMHPEAKEILSRVHERYFADGMCPNPELQKLFDNFKKWMLDIYQSITHKHLDVKITPEVRALLDSYYGGRKDAPMGEIPDPMPNVPGPKPFEKFPEIDAYVENAMKKSRSRTKSSRDIEAKGHKEVYIRNVQDAMNANKLTMEEATRLIGTYAVNEGVLRKALSTGSNMTISEFTSHMEPYVNADWPPLEELHRRIVESAMSTGVTNVPDSVVAEYPDLVAKYTSHEAPKSIFDGIKARSKKPAQETIFQQGEDLPLLSGTPQRAADEAFIPAQTGQQDALFNRGEYLPEIGAGGKPVPDGGDMGPLFGQAEKPNEAPAPGQNKTTASSPFLQKTPGGSYYVGYDGDEINNFPKRSFSSKTEAQRYYHNIRDLIDGKDALFQPAASAGAEGNEYEAARLWREQGTDSPYFQQWFGDSKVVDESGKPLVVYHGTRSKEDFSEFKTFTHLGSPDQAYSAMGLSAGQDGYARIYPLYLSISNPIKVPDTGITWASLLSEAINQKLIDTESANTLWRELDDLPSEYKYNNAQQINKRVADYLIKEGIDGAVYNNEFEGGGASYIPFSPEQIKSVHNRGTFDRNNPNILHQPALDADGQPKGKKTYAFGTDGKEYEFAFGLMDLKDPITSHLLNFQPNEKYPFAQGLQPRMARGDVAGKEQVIEMARTWNNKKALTDSHYLDSGPVIVGPDDVVENGNGRIMAMRYMKEFYPKQYQSYLNDLRGQLKEFGLSEADMQGIENPVLVRYRLSPVEDRAGFTRLAQDGESMQMNAIENAKIDANYINDADISELNIGSKLTMEEALTMASNSKAVDQIMSKIPQEKRNQFIASDGSLSKQGVERIRNAMLLRVYPGEIGERLAEAFVTVAEKEFTENIRQAIYDTLGSMAKMEAMVKLGEREADLALAGDISAAIDKYARLKRGTVSIQDYLSSTDMFGDELTPFQKKLLEYIHTNVRSRKSIRELIAGYAQNVIEAQPRPEQADMFSSKPTKGEILDGVAISLKKKSGFAEVEDKPVKPAVVAPPVDQPVAPAAQPAMAMPEQAPVMPQIPVPAPALPQPASPAPQPKNVPATKDVAMGAPLGTMDGLQNPPLPEAQYMGWLHEVEPVLNKAERALSGKNAIKPVGVMDIDKDLPADTQKQLKQYLGKVYAQMADNKMGMIRYAEGRRDHALLNYSKRYGFDTALGAAFPYEFWYTRSMMNWALRAITKPSILANYGRLQKFSRQQTDDKDGFPTRLRGKIGIPVPFMPDWMGDMYADPKKQVFPFLQMLRPFETMSDDAAKLNRKAESIVMQRMADDDITGAAGDAALKTKTGDVWERALAQANKETELEIGSPMDLATAMISPSIPANIAIQMYNGRTDRISQLPVTKFVQQLTAMAGIGGPRGVNIEAPLRRLTGLPENDKYEDYRMDRMLANLVAEGKVTADDAMRALIDRKGPAFDLAGQRVTQMGTWQYFGAPLGIDFLPEGEKKIRAERAEYEKSLTLWKAGDKQALTKFFDKYPEYAVSMSAYIKDPEERLRKFMISDIWQRYTGMPDLEKKAVREQLGDIFNDGFLNKETRAYGTIRTNTLAKWSSMLGADLPENAPAVDQGKLKMPDKRDSAAVQQYNDERDKLFPNIFKVQEWFYALPTDQQDTYRSSVPELEKYSNWQADYLAKHPGVIPLVQSEKSAMYGLPVEVQQSVYQYRAMKNQNFPAVTETQNQYYAISDKSRRSQFLKQHPELPAYWTWRREYAAQSPKAAPYIMGEESLSKSIMGDNANNKSGFIGTNFNPQSIGPITRQQMQYHHYGKQPLTVGARKDLQYIWEKAGKPGGDLDTFIYGYAMPAITGK